MATSGRWPPWLALPGANRGGELQAIHLRHLEIEQDDLHGMARELDQRFASVPRRDHVVPARAEQVRDQLAVYLLVLGDQHGDERGSPRLDPRRRAGGVEPPPAGRSWR